MLTRGQREKTTGGVNFNKFDSLCEAQNNLNVWGFFHPLRFSRQTVRVEGLSQVIFFTQMQSISVMTRLPIVLI